MTKIRTHSLQQRVRECALTIGGNRAAKRELLRAMCSGRRCTRRWSVGKWISQRVVAVASFRESAWTAAPEQRSFLTEVSAADIQPPLLSRLEHWLAAASLSTVA